MTGIAGAVCLLIVWAVVFRHWPRPDKKGLLALAVAAVVVLAAGACVHLFVPVVSVEIRHDGSDVYFLVHQAKQAVADKTLRASMRDDELIKYVGDLSSARYERSPGNFSIRRQAGHTYICFYDPDCREARVEAPAVICHFRNGFSTSGRQLGRRVVEGLSDILLAEAIDQDRSADVVIRRAIAKVRQEPPEPQIIVFRHVRAERSRTRRRKLHVEFRVEMVRLGHLLEFVAVGPVAFLHSGRPRPQRRAKDALQHRGADAVHARAIPGIRAPARPGSAPAGAALRGCRTTLGWPCRSSSGRPAFCRIRFSAAPAMPSAPAGPDPSPTNCPPGAGTRPAPRRQSD